MGGEGNRGQAPRPILGAILDQVVADEELDDDDTLNEETNPIDEMEDTEVENTTDPFHY